MALINKQVKRLDSPPFTVSTYMVPCHNFFQLQKVVLLTLDNSNARPKCQFHSEAVAQHIVAAICIATNFCARTV